MLLCAKECELMGIEKCMRASDLSLCIGNIHDFKGTIDLSRIT